MDIKHLQTFCVLAETLNFSQTAHHLNFAQSTVTNHIQSLENALGVPLFNRLPRQVTLTSYGERLLVYAHRMLDLETELKVVVSGEQEEPEGTLTIGASETVLTYRLPPLLQAYRKQYPKVQLRLRPFPYGELLDEARQGHVDIAFLFEEAIQSNSLHVRQLLEEPLVLVAAAGHSLATQPIVSPIDLEGEPILFTEINCGYRPMFEHTLSAAGIHPNTNLEFYSLEAIKQCVIAGLGITLVPEVAVRHELETGKLVKIAWDGVPFAVWTQMVWSRHGYVCPAMEHFIAMSESLLCASNREMLREI